MSASTVDWTTRRRYQLLDLLSTKPDRMAEKKDSEPSFWVHGVKTVPRAGCLSVSGWLSPIHSIKTLYDYTEYVKTATV